MLWNAVYTVLLVAVALLAYKGLRRVWKVVSEVVLYWWIFSGAGWYRSYRKPVRIHSYFCRLMDLDEVTQKEVLQFTIAQVDVIDVGRTVRFLESHSHIVLLRDRVDGSLRGILLFKIMRHDSYTLLESGLTLILPHYKGGPYLVLSVVYLSIRELLMHPLTPLYIVCKSFGYESYLLTMKSPRAYPRYDKPTPKSYKKIIEDFVTPSLEAGDKYNRDTCVIERDSDVSHLKEFVTSTMDELDLKNPHIAFYAKHNPGWKKGDFMVVMTPVGLTDILTAVWQQISKIFRKKKKSQRSTAGSSKNKKRPLLRRQTFQDAMANRIMQMNELSKEIIRKNSVSDKKGGCENGENEEDSGQPQPRQTLSSVSSLVEYDLDIDSLFD